MSDQLRRAFAALTAALLAVATIVVAAPPAQASDPTDLQTTVYVDAATGGVDQADCGTGSGHACRTITYALGRVASDGTILVGGGSYAEDLTIAQPVTIIGSGTELDGTLTVGDVNGALDVSGLSISSPLTPLVSIGDTVAGDQIAIHDNTLTGSSDPQTAIDVSGNSADTSVAGNTITGTTDGVDLAGAGPTTYSVTDNTFDITSGDGTAIALSTTDPATLTVTVAGNTGTISPTGRTITRSGAVSVPTPSTLNTLAAAPSTVGVNAAPTTVTTHENPVTFSMPATSASTLPSWQYDLTITPTDVPMDDIDLGYNTDGSSTYLPVSLNDTGTAYTATIGAPSDLTTFPAGSAHAVYFQLSVHALATTGSLAIAMSLDETFGNTVVNTVATSVPFTTATHVNGAPVADAKSLTFARNGAGQTVTLTATDPDGDPITYALGTGPAHGTLNANALPNVTYTPNAAYSGTDSFTYTAGDGDKGGTSAPATVSITVSDGSAPVANDYTYPSVINHGSSGVPINLAPLVSNPDAYPVTYHVSSASAHGGTVSLNGSTATYVPAATHGGTDTFTYWINSSAAKTITLTVDSAPVVPSPTTPSVAHNNTAHPNNTVPVDMTATDSDTTDTLVYAVTTQPGHGDVTKSGSTFTYKPSPNFVGTDQFTVSANDQHGGVSTGTATVTVTDHAPTITTSPAQKTVAYATGSRSVTLTATDIDGDVLRFAKGGGAPSWLTVDPVTGVATFTQPGTHATAFSFPYTVSDSGSVASNALSDTGSYAIAVNTPPTAHGLDVTTKFHTPVSGQLDATDADGINKFHVAHVPTGLSYNATTGAFRYAPPATFAGTTSFAFVAYDKNYQDTSNSATVRITVRKAGTSIGAMSLSPAHPTSTTKPVLVVPVASNGNQAGGTVSVRTGSGVRTARVAKDGTARITLPIYPGGSHTVLATFGGTSTAAAVTQAKSFTFQVSKVGSSLSFTTNPLQLTTKTRNAVATVRVSAPITPNSGGVTIYEGSMRLASGTVHNGVATMQLPPFSLGQHNLTVSFAGTPYVAPSSELVIERVSLG